MSLMMIVASFAVVTMLGGSPAWSQSPDADAVAWTRQHSVALGTEDSPLSRDEAAVLSQIIAGARVIGVGEPFHGHEEPLAYRNRLIRHLVQQGRISAVALESGLSETRRVDDFIQGGPGDATSVVRANLSWRFNELVTNVELVGWLRDWNRDHPRHPVHLYGIDVSGGDAKAEFGRSRASIDALVDYLGHAPTDTAALRAELIAVAGTFSNTGYAALTVDARAHLHASLLAVTDLLGKDRSALIAATSPLGYAWALRIANDALDAERIFKVWPADPAQPMPGAAIVGDIRDRAMAANTLWALGLEGRRGRLLLFESNTHVSAAPMRPANRAGEPGTNAGQELRKALGGGYRVIVTASSLGKSPDDASIGSVDRVLAQSGRPRALLDIRSAPDWWNRPQTLAHGGARVNVTIPKQAFDGIVYIDAIAPARLIGSGDSK